MPEPVPATVVGLQTLALMRAGVSVIVGSRVAAHRPHLMRAVGYRIDADGALTVLLPAAGGRAVLDDLRANGRIAVVFSEPTTHRTLQLKGDDATGRPATDADLALAQRYLGAFADEIAQLGFAAPVARQLLQHVPDDLHAVRFTPCQAFEQTPGPRAGHALAGDVAGAPGDSGGERGTR